MTENSYVNSVKKSPKTKDDKFFKTNLDKWPKCLNENKNQCYGYRLTKVRRIFVYAVFEATTLVLCKLKYWCIRMLFFYNFDACFCTIKC